MVGMRYYFAVPIFLLALLIQTTIMWRLPIFGFSPNLLLCMVIVFSFLYNESYGLILGIAFGLLLDISTSIFLGTQTISFVFVFIVVRIFRNIFNHESIILDMLMALIATPINVMLVWVINRLLGVPDSIVYALKSLLPLMFLNFLLVGVLHLIFVRTVIRHKQDTKFTGAM